MEPLLSQFASRPIYIRGDVDEEKLSIGYWLPSIIPEEEDPDVEQVEADFWLNLSTEKNLGGMIIT